MSPDSRSKLKNLLADDEEYEQFPYVDTTGHITIGIGRNLSDRGISVSEALSLLDNDIIYFISRLNQYLSFFSDLSEPRQIAIINMCFNLGVNGFLAFKNMLEALEKGDYNTAADEMLKSKWADQVGHRAQYLSNIIRTGVM